MSSWQAAANLSGLLLSGLILVGLAYRQRVRRCYAFALYVAANAGFSLAAAIGAAPTSWPGWVGMQLVQRVLSLAVAAEIAARAFGSLPGAARQARLAMAVVVALTLLLLCIDVGAPLPRPTGHGATWEVAAFETAISLLPRLAYATAWLFTTLLLLSLRYVLPIDPLHRTITLGFAPYLMLHSISLGLLREPRHIGLVDNVQIGAFVLLLMAWAWAAWRRETAPPAPSEVVRRLWPWA